MRTRRLPPSLFAIVATVAVFLFQARTSEATPGFPAVIQTELGLAARPDCTLCHTNPSGGLGTVNTPFGAYMRSRGLKEYDNDSLRTALMASAGERHDSDGDGVTDIDELKAGTDPNTSAAAVLVEPAAYGCGAHVAPSAPDHRGTVLLCVGLVALALQSRRRTATVCAGRCSSPSLSARSCTRSSRSDSSSTS